MGISKASQFLSRSSPDYVRLIPTARCIQSVCNWACLDLGCICCPLDPGRGSRQVVHYELRLDPQRMESTAPEPFIGPSIGAAPILMCAPSTSTTSRSVGAKKSAMKFLPTGTCRLKDTSSLLPQSACHSRPSETVTDGLSPCARAASSAAPCWGRVDVTQWAHVDSSRAAWGRAHWAFIAPCSGSRRLGRRLHTAKAACSRKRCAGVRTASSCSTKSKKRTPTCTRFSSRSSTRAGWRTDPSRGLLRHCPHRRAELRATR